MKALNDKQELKARNSAYKVTLEYCDEICNDVKDVGTRKLRKAFTDYVLENAKE